MRTQATISGSDLLLGVIAIRLAVLVAVGWGLTLLPQQVRHSEFACTPSIAATNEAQAPAKIVGSHVADATFDDMRLHD
jgi:hypothetical protein